MFNVCAECGLYADEKEIDSSGPYAICPHCGHRQLFRRLPLYCITGASGTGKSAACQRLVGNLTGYIVLEADLLWRPEFNQPDNQYRDFRNTWLRVAKNIGQNGYPVVLCGSVVPEQMDACPERRYFSDIHYLALVCDDATLIARLQGRPQWRHTSSPEVIDTMLSFNQWFKNYTGHPPIALFDTSVCTVDRTVKAIRKWIKTHETAMSGAHHDL